MHRCQATTQKGVQCRRFVAQEGGKCQQHSCDGCPICFAHMSSNTRTLPCGHTFHTRCVDRWKRTSHTCPMCREPFDQPQYRVSVSVHHLAADQTYSETYVTSNVSQFFSTFNLPQLQPRFITDIFFDVGFDEFINEVFQEIGIRLPSGLRRDASSQFSPLQLLHNTLNRSESNSVQDSSYQHAEDHESFDPLHRPEQDL